MARRLGLTFRGGGCMLAPVAAHSATETRSTRSAIDGAARTLSTLCRGRTRPRPQLDNAAHASTALTTFAINYELTFYRSKRVFACIFFLKRFTKMP